MITAVARSSGIESRRAALAILGQVRDGEPFEVALDRAVAALPDPDRRLTHELAAGVLRQRSALDAQLAPLVPRGWSKVTPDMQDILRLGAYQLTELERVPAHAAVDTSVSLAKATGGPRAAGFVNAVLRRLTRSEVPVQARGLDEAALGREYSHPVWLIRRWLNQFGAEETEALLRWNNTRPRLVLQPARGDLESLSRRLQAAGILAEPAPYGAGLVVRGSRPAELPGYNDGEFVVQNPAQALLARFADLPADASVYDACAAPGGKAIAVGRGSRMVVAGDVSPTRARRLRENLVRAGSGREHVIVADARRPPVRPLSAVVLDVPCLGTGTFSRHPDARWRVTPEALESLVRLQSELMNESAALVSPGGVLIYSTCSLELEENRSQVERFLKNHPAFQRETTGAVAPELLTSEGDLMVLPQRHLMDGAYAARLRRTG